MGKMIPSLSVRILLALIVVFIPLELLIVGANIPALGSFFDLFPDLIGNLVIMMGLMEILFSIPLVIIVVIVMYAATKTKKPQEALPVELAGVSNESLPNNAVSPTLQRTRAISVWVIVAVLGCLWLFVAYGSPIRNVLVNIQASSSPDVTLASATCGDVVLRIVQKDSAIEGTGMFDIDDPHGPSIEKTNFFEAFSGNKRLFSTYLGDGITPEVHLYSSADSIQDMQAFFVVDRSVFTQNDSYDSSRVLIVPDTRLSYEQTKAIAVCFSLHANELNSAMDTPIAAVEFLKPTEGGAAPHVFACTDGRTIAIAGLANSVSSGDEHIGNLNMKGNVVKYARGYSGTMSSSVVDLSPWSTCVDAGGQSFPDYVKSLPQRVEYL